MDIGNICKPTNECFQKYTIQNRWGESTIGQMFGCKVFKCLLYLAETANHSEKQHFLGFASFLSGLGPHPFLPKLLGMCSVQPPLMMVMEELQHQDLLGYLWKCRQVEENLSIDHWMKIFCYFNGVIFFLSAAV